MATGALAEAGLIGLLLRFGGVALVFGAGGIAYHTTKDGSEPSKDGSEPSTPLEPTHLPATEIVEEVRIPIPRSWSTRDPTDVHVHRIPLDETSAAGAATYRAIERALNESSATHAGVPHHSCLGTDTSGQAKKFRVVKVERIENFALWKAYWHRKREMIDDHFSHNVRVRKVDPPTHVPDFAADGTLDPTLNECFLFHGLHKDAVPIIADNGFDERIAALKGGFGAGIYFADQGCKASQYAVKDPEDDDLRVLLINRVTLGDPAYISGDAWRPDRATRDARRPPERGGHFAPGLTFDSVVAASIDYTYGHAVFGSDDSEIEHREIVVYDHRQVYPEYIVHFRLS